MHAPLTKDSQKNILEDRFRNERHFFQKGREPKEEWVAGSWKDEERDPRAKEQHTRIRLWKLLRELDVQPVFLLHLEEELYQLLN